MARPSQKGLWTVEEISIADSPNERVNAYIRSLGQDDDGELYIITSENAGPKGETGKIYKIIPQAK